MNVFDAGGNRAALNSPELIRLSRAVGAMIAVLISFEILWRLQINPPPHIRLWLLLVALLAGLSPARSREFVPQTDLERRLRMVGDILVATVCTLGGGLGTAWIADERPPMLLVLLILVTTSVSIFACRRLLERFGRKLAGERSYLVYGYNDLGIAVASYLAGAKTGAKVVGFIDGGAGPLDHHASFGPVFRDLDHWATTTDFHVDGVIVAQPNASADTIISIRTMLRRQIPNVLLAPPEAVITGQWRGQYGTDTPHCYVLGVREFSFNEKIMKRLIDIVIASIAIIVFAPIMLIAAVLIKAESPGPVIFRQSRYTTDHRLFECYKLRTMRSAPVQDGVIELTRRGDKRVTRIGHFLRRTSLDEIPQFLNVLQGHMSVVGPRPHPPGVKAAGRTYEDIISDFGERYKVKPGLTGYAQVRGLRGNTMTEEDILQRFRCDLDYINNWSVALEFWIILKTFSNGFWGRNAF